MLILTNALQETQHWIIGASAMRLREIFRNLHSAMCPESSRLANSMFNYLIAKISLRWLKEMNQ